MTRLLHINPVALTTSFDRRFWTESLNKRLRLGDSGFSRLALLAGRIAAAASLAAFGLMVFSLTVFSLAAPAQAQSFKPGYWVSSGHEIVLQINACGEDLCGFIAGIALTHPGDAMPQDWHGQSQCGFLMLRVAPAESARNGAPRWKGVLQDPRNGNVYRTTVKFDDSGNLALHGYIGLPVLGKTEIWPKFNGQILEGCHVPSLDGKSS